MAPRAPQSVGDRWFPENAAYTERLLDGAVRWRDSYPNQFGHDVRHVCSEAAPRRSDRWSSGPLDRGHLGEWAAVPMVFRGRCTKERCSQWPVSFPAGGAKSRSACTRAGLASTTHRVARTGSSTGGEERAFVRVFHAIPESLELALADGAAPAHEAAAARPFTSGDGGGSNSPSKAIDLAASTSVVGDLLSRGPERAPTRSRSLQVGVLVPAYRPIRGPHLRCCRPSRPAEGRPGGRSLTRQRERKTGCQLSGCRSD